MKTRHAAHLTILLACLFFAVMALLVKILEGRVNALSLIFYRNLLGLLLLWVSMRPFPLKQKGGRPGLLFFRGLAGTIALTAYFSNLQITSLGLAATYVQAAPLFIAIFSLLFLAEKLKPFAWACLILGFSGVFVIYQPGGSREVLPHLLGLISAVLSALAYTSIRRLKDFYDPRTIIFSFCLIGTLAPGIIFLVTAGLPIPIPAPWHFEWPAAADMLWVVLVALTALGGQYFLTLAFSLGKAGIVGAMGYTQIPMVLLFGLFLGDPLFTAAEWAGVLLIIAGGVGIALVRPSEPA